MALFVSGDRHSYGAGSCSDCHVWCLLASSYPAVRPLVTDLEPLNGFFFLIWYGRQRSDGEQYREEYDMIFIQLQLGVYPVAVVPRLQTKITYNNNSQHQQYIEQTIYPPLGGGKSADRAPSLRGIP